jgi:tRNA modification GTPase
MDGSCADTIAAVATPRGEGGIGVLRVSGPAALRIAQRLFRPSRVVAYRPRRSHTLTHGHVVAPADGAIVDEVLTAYFRAPNTYTGEEMVEIHAHGGPLVLNAILRLVCQEGARLAHPGEFTQRAFLNGRMDLAQAEAVADVIRAKTEGSLRAAGAQLRGALSREVEALREVLVGVLAEVEARIDFPDEELDFEPGETLLTKTLGARRRIADLLRDAAQGRILRDGLHVVIVGKPNVGKSSLLNALLKEDRAIVTEVPGTTRDVIEDYINLRGVPLRISDTAGVRDTLDPVEREGVARSWKRADEADLLLVVLDRSRALDADDLALLHRCRERPSLVVVNKSDLPAAWDAACLAAPDSRAAPVVSMSLKTGAGLDQLIEGLLATAMGSQALGADPPLVTNLRHQKALEDADRALEHVADSLRAAMSPEFVALDLRGALQALGLIVGETATDDILDRVFSQFCIGK